MLVESTLNSRPHSLPIHFDDQTPIIKEAVVQRISHQRGWVYLGDDLPLQQATPESLQASKTE